MKYIKETINNWKTLINYFKNIKPIEKFVNLLMTKVTMDIIELGRGHKTKTIVKSLIFDEKIEYYTNYLINKFTYKEWKKILKTDDFYKKVSDNKTEDIRTNLNNFLRVHYLEMFDIIDMPTYSKYQSKNKTDIAKIIYIQDAYAKEQKYSGIFIIYNDNSRVCYNNKTKERLIPELLEVKEETLLITLVNIKMTLLDKIKNIFFEEA